MSETLSRKADWSAADAEDLYQIPSWGRGYFSVGTSGALQLELGQRTAPRIDLHRLVHGLIARGYDTPLLLRFGDVLRDRIRSLNKAFEEAIDDWDYRGRYRGVFPVKVNQQCHVVEELLRHGEDFHLGLEAGSKPELMIALAMHRDPESLLICNGFKDDSYIRMALLAMKLGKHCVVVVDRFDEIETVLRLAEELELKPRLGIRVRLSSQGAGKWVESGGEISKFGLSAFEAVEAVEVLRSRGLLDSLELLHFHCGSQVTDIHALKLALKEASQFYVELARLGAKMGYLDVGGGLGIDYDGSQSNSNSSINYTMGEYASDVVASVYEACEAKGVDHPMLVSESGRALVAHHSLLVFDIVGHQRMPQERPARKTTESQHQILCSLEDTYGELEVETALASYHRALQLKDEAQSLFRLGYLSLEERAFAERMFWAICSRVLAKTEDDEDPPEELLALRDEQPDLYYGNFSIFQSVPDHWAVHQLFPILPIHRLDEEPTRRGILVDLTCDSDGKVDRFIGRGSEDRVLPLHDWRPKEPYYVAFCLIGAYQEVLGDLHNLFGDTNVVHLSLGQDGDIDLEVGDVIEGDTIAEVLRYVQYDPNALVAGLRSTAERALREERITKPDLQELLRVYKAALNQTTYLDRQL